MTTGLEVAPDPEPTASIFLTTSMPLVTEPKTTCLPSSQSVLTVQRKNLCVYRRRCAFYDALRTIGQCASGGVRTHASGEIGA